MRTIIPALLALIAVLTSCTDPVIPSIRNDAEILLIDGDIMNLPGRSSVQIDRWVPDGRRYLVQPQLGMVVVSVAENGTEVQWNEQETAGRYEPPMDFRAAIGSTYYLRITTPAGITVESRPEMVHAPVPIATLSVGL